MGPILYKKVETLQIIILHIYIVICCYLWRWVTIGLQTFFPENFVYFWSLVCPWRLPGVIRGARQDAGGKSRFKNTSTQNFEVLTWILACICTRMLWIIWLNAHSHYLTVFVLSYFGCRQFWENGQFRPRTPCQNEPKICRRHRRTLKFHIFGGLGVLMHLGKYGVISFTGYRVMIKCVPYSGVWPQSGGVLALR